MRNLLPLLLAIVLGIACFIPAPASAYRYHGRYYPYYYGDHYYRYRYQGHYYQYSLAGVTIGTGVGLSASAGAQGIIAIGKWIVARGVLTICELARVVCAEASGKFKT
jgi:hypothetical protein